MANRFREKVVEEPVEDPRQRAAAEATATAQEPEEGAESTSEDTAAATQGKPARAIKGLAKVLGGDLLADKLVLRQLPLVLLCLLFLLLMVANRYRVEALSREKIALQERINDLREHRIQMQKQYQKNVKISQIAEELSSTGVGITSGPPYEIED